MSTPINMSNEQFQQLLSSIHNAGGAMSIDGRPGSFSKCTARFDGERNYNEVEAFVSKINIYKAIEKISDKDAIEGLPLLLTDRASVWWQGVRNEADTWEKTISLIRAAFSPSKQPHQVYMELFSEKQSDNTSTDVFICNKRALLSQLPANRHNEEAQLDLIYGLLKLKIREKVPRTTVSTFHELLEKARNIEACEAEIKNDHGSHSAQHGYKANKTKSRCTFCNFRGHTIDVCRKRLKSVASGNSKTIKEARKQESRDEGKLSCYGCGSLGYYRSNCPNCKRDKKLQPPQVNFHSIEPALKLGEDPPVIPVLIAGVAGVAQVDTAARTSIASKSLYEQLVKRGVKFNPFLVDVTLADGSTKQENSLATRVDITLGNRTLPIDFLVLTTTSDNCTLLGIDFLESAGIILNLPQRSWRFIDEKQEWHQFGESDLETTTTVISSVTTGNEDKAISPFVEWYLDCDASPISELSKTPQRATETEDSFWHLIPLMTPPKKQILPSENDYSPGQTQAIFRDAIPAYMKTPPRDPRLATKKARKRTCTSIKSIDVKLRPNEATNLDKYERLKLNKFLEDNDAVFNNNKESTPYIEHFINLTKNEPIAVPPYRLSPIKRQQLENELKKMLADDIIEECESAWAAPVVLIPKKDGSTRVCIDYRQLNQVTVPDRYPLPRMDDLLQAAKSTKFISTLDLKTGYWQVRVAEKDRDKTSFITPFGTYCFKRMPFGLRNAPATFQRLMDRFRSGLSSITILIYLDDLIVCSSSFDQHLDDLDKIFKRLRLFKLNCNRQKCNFCCAEVKYLGHVITNEGVAPDPEKIKAVVEWPTPATLKQLISFLQTCSWYRRFVPNYASIAQPLTELTKKNASWKWGTQHQKAMDTLKKLLTTTPILRQVNENLPFTLKTDASNYALGAVLVQGEDAEEHPIEYASRLLTAAERNYSTTEREALAIVWAVNRFRGYIEDADVTVITDHQALKWLMSIKSPTGRIARWALLLQAYNLKVVYRPGRTNVVADSLSRLACSKHNVATCDICSTHIDLPHRRAEDVRNEQLKDTQLKDIIECLENKQSEEKYLRWTNMGYMLNNGILFKYNPEIDCEEAQLVIPKGEQLEILKLHHDAPTAGHYGIERTYQRIAKRYFWLGMRQDIAKHVSRCIECQRYKNENLKPAGLLQTTPSRQRFEVIAVDLFGPLPPSKDNKRWIFIVEDLASRWVELFALEEATAENCAVVLLQEVFLRYGIARRMISDNGTQFISGIMQHLTYCLGIQQSFTPVYHPQANPVERKNRDLKTQLGILVRDTHTTWPEKLSSIRFAMNTAHCESTGYSAAYLTFGRELRSPDDVQHDVRAIVEAENFIPQMTPRLLQLLDILNNSKEITQTMQIRNQRYSDVRRRQDPGYKPGDKVWVKTHAQSKATKGFASKFTPRQDGPYVVLTKCGASTYEVASIETPDQPLGKYHTSALVPYQGATDDYPTPVVPLRRRGRPRKSTKSVSRHSASTLSRRLRR